MKKFKLFNTTWTIKIVDVIETGEPSVYQFGSCDGISHTIIIAKKVGGIQQSEREMKLTLIHEILHAILQTGQYNEHSNEPLVEWEANCIYALLEQKILQ